MDKKCFGQQVHMGWGRVWLLDTEVTELLQPGQRCPSHAGQSHLNCRVLELLQAGQPLLWDLEEWRANKAAEGKESRTSSKHPMLHNSENNELDRFQKQSLLRASARFA